MARGKSTTRDEPTAVLVHLSGDLRGTSQYLQGERIVLGTSPAADVRLRAHERSVGAEHARLVRSGGSYELHTTRGRSVWVNGDRAERQLLASGDVLEIGPEGPVLRFRLYGPGSEARKSLREAFEDCRDGARRSRAGRLGRAGIFLAGLARELATQTTIRFRAVVLGALLILIIGMALLAVRGERLEDRLESENARLRAVAELVETSRLEALRPEHLDRLRAELEGRVSRADERLRSLEERTDAPARIFERAAGSIVFLQGSYGFVDVASGLPYRLAGVDAAGQPLTDEAGRAIVTTDGDGPLLERSYTGTAWVATDDGLLVTNRHIGLPWEQDLQTKAALAQGVKASRRRFIGYLPAVDKALAIELVAASDSADLALLRCRAGTGPARALELRTEPVRPGEEVLVLGYPLGISALVARSDPKLAHQLMAERPALDFWSVARRLSAHRQIAPLATRGIVGQVTPTTVVYDAQTTFGGSGGPVLDLSGRVVAVNSAVLASFGGSNMGVPAAEVQRLLERAAPKPP